MRLYGLKTKSTISDIDFDISERFFQKLNFLMVFAKSVTTTADFRTSQNMHDMVKYDV